MASRRPTLLRVAAALLAVYWGTSAAAATLEVCASGCAHTTIQGAIDASAEGDTVLVHDGTYLENVVFPGHTLTVESVNGPAVTTIDGGGIDRTVKIGPQSGALRGFTVTNGLAVAGSGGGIACGGQSCEIANCDVIGNAAELSGGGVYCVNGTCEITDSTFSTNSANNGAGLDLYESTFSISGLVVTDNTASNNGGGLYISGFSNGTISASTISDNTAVDEGGGLWMCCYSNITITGSLFQGNTADHGAGMRLAGFPGGIAHVFDSEVSNNIGSGIQCGTGGGPLSGVVISGNSGGGLVANECNDIELDRCVITGNWTSGDGGGIKADYIPITSSVIAGNRASNGGGLFAEWVSLTSCTVAANLSQGTVVGGGGVLLDSPYASRITSSILWGNDSPGFTGSEDQIWAPGVDVDVAYSTIQGGWPGEGNSDEDPLFLNPRPASEAPTTAGDYHLGHGSPCIDTATPDGAPVDDIDGEPRPQGPGFDRGADEYAGLFADGFESGDTTAWSIVVP